MGLEGYAMYGKGLFGQIFVCVFLETGRRVSSKVCLGNPYSFPNPKEALEALRLVVWDFGATHPVCTFGHCTSQELNPPSLLALLRSVSTVMSVLRTARSLMRGSEALGSGGVWPLTLPLPKWLAILFLSLSFVFSVVATILILQLGTFRVFAWS